MRRRNLVFFLSGLAAAAALGGVLIRPRSMPSVARHTTFGQALVAKGALLAAIGDCAVCHSGREGQAYAGGIPLETPFGQVYASNITPDPDTGIGTWSEAAFRRAMRQGVDRAVEFLYPAFPTTTIPMSPTWDRDDYRLSDAEIQGCLGQLRPQ